MCRQDSSKFKPTRSQRQVLQRFSNYVRDGGREGEKGWGPPSSSTTAKPSINVDKDEQQKEKAKQKGKGKAKKQNPVEFEELVNGADWSRSTTEYSFKNKFEVSAPSP